MTYRETWAYLNSPQAMSIHDPSKWGFADLLAFYAAHALLLFMALRLVFQLSLIAWEWSKDRRAAKRYDALRDRARAAGRTIPEQRDFERG